MAWPCISRVCCLARFWSQLDKSDLSVPLTIHNYSDIEEQEDGPHHQRGGAPPRGSARPPAPAPRPRDPATQYRRDFRAWPLPRRGDAFPWPAPGRAACALPGSGGPEQLRPRPQADGGHTTSYSGGSAGPPCTPSPLPRIRSKSRVGSMIPSPASSSAPNRYWETRAGDGWSCTGHGCTQQSHSPNLPVLSSSSL
uniref:MAP6 domain containing 1 n=1 Tax=Amazona collaria TaxID=241587 RepID=A0A8B9F211_9PSIT